MLPPDNRKKVDIQGTEEDHSQEEADQSTVTTQQGATDPQQQEGESQSEGAAQTTQQGATDPQQEHQPAFRRWSQNLAAASSALKKKAKESIDKTVKKLDKILPGESTDETRLRLLKAEEAQVFRENLQPGMELANVYASEISVTFGVRDVSVTSSGKGREVVVTANYLDASNNIAGPDDPDKAKLDDTPSNSIPFTSHREIHEWLARARMPEPLVAQLLARTIMNVTGANTIPSPIDPTTSPTVVVPGCDLEVLAAAEPVVGAAASSIVPLSEEKTVFPQAIYKIGPLSPQQKNALRAFCISLASSTTPRLRVPYQEVIVGEGKEKEVILAFYGFPKGERARLPFMQELHALSLEHTEDFKTVDILFKAILEHITPSPTGSTPEPLFKMLFDLVTRRSFLQIQTESLLHPWGLHLVGYICNKLGIQASLVDTLPRTKNCCARNESFYLEKKPYEVCTSALGGLGSVGIPITNTENSLEPLTKILRDILIKCQCAVKFCKNIPDAQIVPQHRSFCCVNVGRAEPESASLVLRILNAETQNILPNQVLFTQTRHYPDDYCVYAIDIDGIVKLTPEQAEKVAWVASKIPDIEKNIEVVVKQVASVLHFLGAESKNPLSLLECSRTTLNKGDVAVPALELSWGKPPWIKWHSRKSDKPEGVSEITEGVLLFDHGIVVASSIFTRGRTEVQRLAEELGFKLGAFMEEKNLPDTAHQESFSSKFVGKAGTPADQTVPGAFRRFSKRVSSFFERSKSEGKSTTQKKVRQPISDRLRNIFIAIATAVVLAAIIYIVIPLIPRLKNIPDALQVVGSILTGALISCLAYTCATKIQSNSQERE
ncbi:hypothetical protein [Neorickettsia sennetsu]|uniref:Uncharacterized protein n=1 Tax=Ehrlichia sennetsu (strain ATCC VR-367 / Miyayama) TaxID=222891 RepID=Q2GDW2_EHRS3|nr:hypothetical protein [Neorickettsia sennetsu]ABD46146.1 hypothetical protein NSE_0449 [Neorickettsia sennetsu str. Miyayama]